jgi:hypothetical protein
LLFVPTCLHALPRVSLVHPCAQPAAQLCLLIAVRVWRQLLLPYVLYRTYSRASPNLFLA